MKKFREYLKKHTRRITNFKKKNIKLLKIKQQESYENAKVCYVCGETFEDNDKNDKKNVKLEIVAIIQVNTEVLHIAYVI